MNNIATRDNITKQSIRKRMLRFAADYMKVRNPHLLDPIVTLFIESLSEEVYKLSEDISSIEYRMLNKLLDIPTSDISLSAQPAHCIAHAMSEESLCQLTKEVSFVLSDQRSAIKDKTSLSFYPVCNTNIINGFIKYTVHNGLFYQLDKDQTKTLLARSRNFEFNDKRSFWIALDLKDDISSFENISFFFDFPGVSNKEDSLQILPLLQWKLNGKYLDTYNGIYFSNNDEDTSVVRLFKELEVSETIDLSILDFYNKHFRTVSCIENIASEKRTIPEEIKQYFPDHFTHDLDSPLLWIEIEYPSNMKSELIEILTISINAFPIANKILHSKVIEINKALPIIALETGAHESLLSVHSVTDASGIEYYELPFDDTLDTKYRTYTLRRGGYERYSARDAREYLNNFITSLENHSSIKSGNVTDDNVDQSLVMVHDLIKHLKKTIIKTDEILEVQNYLLLDLPNDKDIFFIKYWTTCCGLANNIKQQTSLECISDKVLVNDIYLLTSTTGGSYVPKGIKQQNLRIQSLTKRTVFVTDEDIVEFCKNHLRSLVTDVKIAKGIQEVSSVNETGFVLTTDIHLIVPRQTSSLIENSEIEALKKMIQARTPQTKNFRIFIDNEK